jgi:GTP-binding protein
MEITSAKYNISSALVTLLTKTKNLAKTSGTPGKTQLINHFEIESSGNMKGPKEKWFLVDLPGYGYAKRSISDRNRWEQMIDGYLRKRENLVQVFVLIDSRHGPQKNDLEFVNQIDSWQVPFSLVFTKSDKEKPGVVARNVQAFLDKLRETWQFLPRHFVTSAEKKEGREELLTFLQFMNNQVKENKEPKD